MPSGIMANPLDVLNNEMARIRNQGIRLVIRTRTRFDDGRMADAIGCLMAAYPAIGSRYSTEGRCFSLDGPGPGIRRIGGCVPNDVPRWEGRMFGMTIVDGDAGDVLMIDVDHTLTDGRGLVTLARGLCDAYDGKSLEGEADRSIDRLWDVCDLDDEVDEEADPVSYTIPMRCVRGRTLDSAHTLTENDTGRAIDAAGDIGVTVNDLLVASMMMAIEGRCGRTERRGVIVPVDLRRHLRGEWDDRTCNLSSSIDVAVDGSGSIDSVAIAVSDRVRKMARGALGMGIMERMRSEGESSVVDSILGSRCDDVSSALLTNIGRIAPMSIDGEVIEDLYFLASPNWPPTLICAASTYEGRMTVSIPYCEGSMTSAEANAWSTDIVRGTFDR